MRLMRRIKRPKGVPVFMTKVLLIGTADSKSEELQFIKQSLRHLGLQPILADVSVGTQAGPRADIRREEILESIPGIQPDLFATEGTRSQCMDAMCHAISHFVPQYCKTNSIQGVIAIGGSGGTAIGTAAMRGLPLGFPKVMITTMATGNTAQYIEGTDINLFPSVVDVAGLNEISKMIFNQAAAALAGMAQNYSPLPPTLSRPLVAATMFGNTTACVNEARSVLEKNGYDVLVFHATGNGGRTMEKLILSGKISGVLDLTTTEIADEIVGGVLTAGPSRLEAAAKMNIPTVIAPGCLDMVNFHGRDSIPSWFSGRKFYPHTPEVTLMRTNAEEMFQIGEFLGEKINQYPPHVIFQYPNKGFSALGSFGESFWAPEWDAQLLAGLKNKLKNENRIKVWDGAINDPGFGESCANWLLQAMEQQASKKLGLISA